jgi:hypothetical protein
LGTLTAIADVADAVNVDAVVVADDTSFDSDDTCDVCECIVSMISLVALIPLSLDAIRLVSLGNAISTGAAVVLLMLPIVLADDVVVVVVVSFSSTCLSCVPLSTCHVVKERQC